MESGDPNAPLLSRLRAETRALHDAAEQVPFMKALVGGTLPRDAYSSALPQLRTVRRALEEALGRHRENTPALAACLHEYHFTASAFDRDIAWFNSPADAPPNSGTRDFLRTLEETEKRDPVLLLGMFYVLEGSNMGAAFLRKKVHALYGATDEAGTASMNVHGPELHARWKEFVGTLDSLELSPEQKDGMVEAAKRTFDAVGRLYGASYRPESATAA